MARGAAAIPTAIGRPVASGRFFPLRGAGALAETAHPTRETRARGMEPRVAAGGAAATGRRGRAGGIPPIRAPRRTRQSPSLGRSSSRVKPRRPGSRPNSQTATGWRSFKSGDGFTQNPTNGDIFEGTFEITQFDPDDGPLQGIELALNTTLTTSSAFFADPFFGVATRNVMAEPLFLSTRTRPASWASRPTPA